MKRITNAGYKKTSLFPFNVFAFGRFLAPLAMTRKVAYKNG